MAQDAYMRFVRSDDEQAGHATLLQKLNPPGSAGLDVTNFNYNALTVGTVDESDGWVGEKSLYSLPASFTTYGLGAELVQTADELRLGGWSKTVLETSAVSFRIRSSARLVGEGPKTYGIAEGAAHLETTASSSVDDLFGWSAPALLSINPASPEIARYVDWVRDVPLPEFPAPFVGSVRYTPEESWDCNAPDGFVEVSTYTLGYDGRSLYSQCEDYVTPAIGNDVGACSVADPN